MAVALVSANFVASDFIWRYEMPELLGAARQGRLQLLWVYLSPAGWEETELKEFQATHNTSKPLITLSAAERDEVLKRVAQQMKWAALSATDRFVGVASSGPT